MAAKSVSCGSRNELPAAKLEVQYVDLGDLQTVREFTKRALDFGGTIDVLLNNAGVLSAAPPQISCHSCL